MKEVYTLTMIHTTMKDGKFFRTDCSVQGIEDNSQVLEDAALNNDGDMFECFYEYAVIEKVKLSAMAAYQAAEAIQWYHAIWADDHPNEPKEIVKCDPPEWSKNIFNWWG